MRRAGVKSNSPNNTHKSNNNNNNTEPKGLPAGVSFGATTSNHRCCAERLLLDSLTREARRHGFRSHHVIAFVRRKAGPDLSVWRQLSDGAVGCAAPCVLCHRAICNFGLRVHCPLLDGTWFSGRLTDDGAPPGVATSGQARAFKSVKQLEATGAADAVKRPAAGVASTNTNRGRESSSGGATGGRTGVGQKCTPHQWSQLQRQRQTQQLQRRGGSNV
ncbi:MAG: hypothetical protein WDW36_008989 [Sanguina aurantia]